MTSELPPHAEFLSFAETLADISREMLLKASKTVPEITIKADASYVTATDKAVEQKLRDHTRFHDVITYGDGKNDGKNDGKGI